MFEQHPVPQEISSYQFRLVGDMTLKQFFQLAGGAVVGLIIYSLPIPGFLRWPLVVIAVVAGAAFAFLPIQDRPLEKWIAAFFRSIYSPTIFVWQKNQPSTQYFAAQADPAAQITPDIEPGETVHNQAAHSLDTSEKNFLNKIALMLGGPSSATKPEQQVPSEPAPPPIAPVPSEPGPTIISEYREEPVTEQPKIEIEQKEEPKELEVPKIDEIKIEPKGFDVIDETPTQTQTQPVGEVFNASQGQLSGSAAQFSPEAAPPTPPSQPNIVVGQVMDINGKIVEGAILEITDNAGRPTRALKTNRVGHFAIVTPLANGEYRIATEKEGLMFDPVSIVASGEILNPIVIRSKNELPPPPPPEPVRAVWKI